MPTSAWRRFAWPAVVLLCCATIAFGWWSKARCILDSGWNDAEEWTAWCYTDVYPLWFAENLANGAIPYVDHPVEYPVLIGAQMLISAKVVEAVGRGGPGGGPAFYHVTALIGAPLLLLTLWRLRAMGASVGRLAWYAGAPTIVLYAFLNWDPLPVLLLVLALEAHRRGDDTMSGVLVGLGTAAKLYPVLLLPLVVLARLAQRRVGDAVRHAGAALAAWALVNVPVVLFARDGWMRFWELNRERRANFDSLWYLAEQWRDRAFDLSALNRLSGLAFVVGAALVVAIGVRRYPPDEWWRLLAPVLCVFLVVNKVYSPQYSLWLLPLLPLTLWRAAPYAAFAFAEVWVFTVEFPFLGGVVGVPQTPGYGVLAVALVARALALVWIAADVLVGPPRREPEAVGDREPHEQPPMTDPEAAQALA